MPAPGCRVRLAATCRALRAASADWFRNDRMPLFSGVRLPKRPEHIRWLSRVQGALFHSWSFPALLPHVQLIPLPLTAAQVMLTLTKGPHILMGLAEGGVRIVELSIF